MTEASPLLELCDITVLLGGERRLFGKKTAPVRAVGGVSLDLREGEILGDCRRVGLRQDHARPHDPRPSARGRGRNPSRRASRQWPCAKARPHRPGRYPLRASGRRGGARSVVEHRPYPRRRAGDPRRRPGGTAARAGRRGAGRGRARRLGAAALSARAVRRPAAARRLGPHPAAAAAGGRARRADLGARHVSAGDGPEPVARIAPAGRADLPVHLARSFGGRAVLRPGRDHVSRPDRRAGAGERDFCPAFASLHPGIAGRSAAARPRAARGSPAGRRRAAECGASAAGLRVRAALPICRAGLRRGPTGQRIRRTGPPGSVPALARHPPATRRRARTGGCRARSPASVSGRRSHLSVAMLAGR